MDGEFDSSAGVPRFILRRRVNVLVSTHSSVVAGVAATDQLFMVQRVGRRGTVVRGITPTTVGELCEELGLRPSFNFDAEGHVFCEGKVDASVMRAIRDKFHPRLKVDFIDAGGWKSMNYYANARLASAGPLCRHVFVLYDGDTDDEKRQREKARLTSELRIPSEHIMTLPRREIESYLLDADAVKAAFPLIDATVGQLREEIAALLDAHDPKEAATQLLRRHHCGPYDETRAALIAAHFPRVPDDLRHVMQRVEAAVSLGG